VRIRNEEEAIEAYVSSRGGQIPEGYYVTATCVVDLGFALSDGACLWSVGLATDDEGSWLTEGSMSYLGPDGKVWTFPANLNFYDPEIIKKALRHIYVEDVADLVDCKALAEEVKLITRSEKQSIWSLSVAARRGKLRGLTVNQ
jgi:hypothetical protein